LAIADEKDTVVSRWIDQALGAAKAVRFERIRAAWQMLERAGIAVD
jgi:hypothetical protein